jgi:hypothetical protein
MGGPRPVQGGDFLVRKLGTMTCSTPTAPRMQGRLRYKSSMPSWPYQGRDRKHGALVAHDGLVVSEQGTQHQGVGRGRPDVTGTDYRYAAARGGSPGHAARGAWPARRMSAGGGGGELLHAARAPEGDEPAAAVGNSRGMPTSVPPWASPINGPSCPKVRSGRNRPRTDSVQNAWLTPNFAVKPSGLAVNGS